MINWLWIVVVLGASALPGQSDGVPLREVLAEVFEVTFLDERSCALVYLVQDAEPVLWRCGTSRTIGGREVELESVTAVGLVLRALDTPAGSTSGRILVEISGTDAPRITFVSRGGAAHVGARGSGTLGAPDALPP